MRAKISRETLITSLAVDKWFTVRACSLDMTPHSFNQTMKALPEEYISREKVGCVTKFKIHSRKYAKLMEFVKAKQEKPKPQKITKNKLTVNDLCQNLAEGMKKNILGEG